MTIIYRCHEISETLTSVVLTLLKSRARAAETEQAKKVERRSEGLGGCCRLPAKGSQGKELRIWGRWDRGGGPRDFQRKLGVGSWEVSLAYPNLSLVVIITWWWQGLVPFGFKIPECMCWGSLSSEHLLAPEQGRWARYDSGPSGPLGGDREVGHGKLWELTSPLLYPVWRRKWHPTQYSCLENPMDRGVWWATVHGVAKSWTRLSNFCVCIPSEGWHGLIKDALERECGASKKDKGDFFFF